MNFSTHNKVYSLYARLGYKLKRAVLLDQQASDRLEEMTKDGWEVLTMHVERDSIQNELLKGCGANTSFRWIGDNKTGRITIHHEDLSYQERLELLIVGYSLSARHTTIQLSHYL